MEVVGLALAVTAADEAAGDLAHLEQDARTVCLYLDKIGDAIGRSPSEFPQDFMEWLVEEKKLLQDSIAQIEHYTETARKRLQTSRLLGGVAYAIRENEMAEIQKRLMTSISTLGHMKDICQQRHSLESRVAALEASWNEHAQIQAASTVAVCSKSSYNFSVSTDECDGTDSEPSFHEILKKSRPYKRATTRMLLFAPNTRDEASIPDSAQAHRRPSTVENSGPPPIRIGEILWNNFHTHILANWTYQVLHQGLLICMLLWLLIPGAANELSSVITMLVFAAICKTATQPNIKPENLFVGMAAYVAVLTTFLASNQAQN
ncbi:hypothetical protein B0T25DRAFT_612950 [Lasiosphaeria hispida]|uniref:Uncharacterized protein n=1 Tax=Lasiosphaeria hispida TaxID=260671 RepID=A0AAJ0HBT8_9PEZI|nr:hypothetical protein B0T25DRAFT_612950 [Lasiosphaeria hispida]